jgi:(1->4)-alpha-D-glucan 1-alpha-D-glucosylmutase
MRLQQYTGPVHAKGVEDTAFYRYNVLLSLNEVGGKPGRFGVTPAEFHHENQFRLERWPLELTATSTHDSKLGEDVRARINVLSELPEEWRRGVGQWLRMNAPHRTQLGGEWAPDRNDEYRFYQVLLGVWPADAGAESGPTSVPASLVARLCAYMLKAAKEAKIHTSWINDNERYDAALLKFVEDTLTGQTALPFLESFRPLARRVAWIGMINSLAQLVLKIASPGTPDFYQGSELWDLNLVDPDNRRPVDYTVRAAALRELAPLLDDVGDNRDMLPVAEHLAAVQHLLASWEDGRIKLLVTSSGLRLRRQLSELFLSGQYLPLEADLTVKGGIVAFARQSADRAVIAVVPRLIANLVSSEGKLPVGLNVWCTSRVILPPALADTPYRNVFTGEVIRPVSAQRESWIPVGEALATCPVALLKAL